MGLLGDKQGLLGEKASLLSPHEKIALDNGGTSADDYDRNTGTLYLNDETRVRFKDKLADMETTLADPEFMKLLDKLGSETKDSVQKEYEEMKLLNQEPDGEVDLTKYPMTNIHENRKDNEKSAFFAVNMAENTGNHEKGVEYVTRGQENLDSRISGDK